MLFQSEIWNDYSTMIVILPELSSQLSIWNTPQIHKTVIISFNWQHCVLENPESLWLQQNQALRDGESNPGLPRDRRGYLPLYYHGLAAMTLTFDWRSYHYICRCNIMTKAMYVHYKGYHYTVVHTSTSDHYQGWSKSIDGYQMLVQFIYSQGVIFYYSLI